MTSVRIVWLLLCLVWVAAEARLARQSRLDQHTLLHSEQRSQRWLWLSVLVSLGLGLEFKQLAWLPIPIDYLPRQLLAMLLFAAGLYLRYWAVGQLGKFFTTDITIQRQQHLITSGPYRWIRHPAYTGLLMALTGAGLAMGDYLALLMLSLPTFLAFKVRIDLEEQMLQKAFTDSYLNYSKNTWKLLPWLY